MTDHAGLIARLRSNYSWSTLPDEAADAIEALVAERDALKKTLADHLESVAAETMRADALKARVKEQAALIERMLKDQEKRDE